VLWGAFVGGLAWTGLQALGGYLVGHQLRHASELYAFLPPCSGLLSWIFLGTRVALYAAELNVVVARRLWPRSLVQPPLTAADRRTLAAIAHQQERRPEETVELVLQGRDRPLTAVSPARRAHRRRQVLVQESNSWARPGLETS
jgi:hypothetical protein